MRKISNTRKRNIQPNARKQLCIVFVSVCVCMRARFTMLRQGCINVSNVYACDVCVCVRLHIGHFGYFTFRAFFRFYFVSPTDKCMHISLSLRLKRRVMRITPQSPDPEMACMQCADAETGQIQKKIQTRRREKETHAI